MNDSITGRRQIRKPKHLSEGFVALEDCSSGFQIKSLEQNSTSIKTDDAHTQQIHDLVELGKVTEFDGLNEAIHKAVEESPMLAVDWSNPRARFIGQLCKIYWDGENQWFYARILSYRASEDIFYLFYLDDLTGEWITLDKECIMVVRDVVTTRLKKASPWPAMAFWTSALAATLLTQMKGYIRDGEFVEFFSDLAQKEYAFLKPTFIEENDGTGQNGCGGSSCWPKQRSKKLDAAIRQSEEERTARTALLQNVITLLSTTDQLCRVFSRAPGEGLVGMRIRVGVGVVKTPMEGQSQSQSQAPNTSKTREDVQYEGTIVKYYAQRIQKSYNNNYINHMYLIVFDDVSSNTQKEKESKSGRTRRRRRPRPRWISGSGGGCLQDVDVDPEFPAMAMAVVRLDPHPGIPYPNPYVCGSDVQRSRSGSDDDRRCLLCRLDKDAFPPEETDTTTDTTADTTMAISTSAAVIRCCSRCSSFSHECCMPPPLPYNDNDRDNGNGTLSMYMAACSRRYRVKESGSGSKDNTTLIQSQNHTETESHWICWKCNDCECCGVSSWNRDVSPLSLKTLELQAPDRFVRLCVECTGRYKDSAEYCPICFRLHPPEPVELGLGLGLEQGHSLPPPPFELPSEENQNPSDPPTQMNSAASTAVSVAVAGGIPTKSSSGGGGGETKKGPGRRRSSEKNHISKEDPSPSPLAFASEPASTKLEVDILDKQVQCNECFRWVHSVCEGMDDDQYEAVTRGTHPVWGGEYLCPPCRARVCEQITNQLKKLDKNRLFAEPVPTTLASNYLDIIRSPMDLQSIDNRIRSGQYKSLQLLRADVELMCLNALTFNKVGDEYWLDARQFSQGALALFSSFPRVTSISAYGMEVSELCKKHDATARGSLHSNLMSKVVAKTQVMMQKKTGGRGRGRGRGRLPTPSHLSQSVPLSQQPLPLLSSERSSVPPISLPQTTSVDSSTSNSYSVSSSNVDSTPDVVVVAIDEGSLPTQSTRVNRKKRKKAHETERELETESGDVARVVDVDTVQTGGDVTSALTVAVAVAATSGSRPKRRTTRPAAADGTIMTNGNIETVSRGKWESRQPVDIKTKEPGMLSSFDMKAVEPGSGPHLNGFLVDYSTACAFALSFSDAVSMASMDCCVLCGSWGCRSHLLTCKGCCESFHSFCVSGYKGRSTEVPIVNMSDSVRRDWRCPACEVCATCRRSVVPVFRSVSVSDPSEDCIRCLSCDKNYHKACSFPVIPRGVGVGKRGTSLLSLSSSSFPMSSWICSHCVQCRMCKLGTMTWNNNVRTAHRVDESPSGMLPSLSSWGLQRDLCIVCSGKAGDVLGTTTTTSDGGDGILCKQCGDPCSVCTNGDENEDTVRCQGCACPLHFRCVFPNDSTNSNNNNNKNINKSNHGDSSSCLFTPSTMEGVLCKDCTLLTSSHRDTHLGRGRGAWDMLDAVATIQRERMIRKQALLSSQRTAMEIAICQQWEGYRPWYHAVVQWSFVLWQRLQLRIQQSPTIQSSVNRGMKEWNKRAVRFSRMCARYSQQHSGDGPEKFGAQLSAPSLVRLAQIAAAYLSGIHKLKTTTTTMTTCPLPSNSNNCKLTQSPNMTPSMSTSLLEMDLTCPANILTYLSKQHHCKTDEQRTVPTQQQPSTPSTSTSHAVSSQDKDKDRDRDGDLDLSHTVNCFKAFLIKLSNPAVNIGPPDCVLFSDYPPVPTLHCKRLFSTMNGSTATVSTTSSDSNNVSKVPGNDHTNSTNNNNNNENDEVMKYQHKKYPKKKKQQRMVTISDNNNGVDVGLKAKTQTQIVSQTQTLSDTQTVTLTRAQMKEVMVDAVGEDGHVYGASSDDSYYLKRAVAQASTPTSHRILQTVHVHETVPSLSSDSDQGVGVGVELAPEIHNTSNNINTNKSNDDNNTPSERSSIETEIETETETESDFPRVCGFCGCPEGSGSGCGDNDNSVMITVTTDSDFVTGRLLPLPLDSVCVHANCARWASGVVERQGVLLGVKEALERSRSRRCVACGEQGAAVGCFYFHRLWFHLRCVYNTGCILSHLYPSNQDVTGQHDIHTSVKFLDVNTPDSDPVVKNIVKKRLATVTATATARWVPQEPLRTMRISLDSEIKSNDNGSENTTSYRMVEVLAKMLVEAVVAANRRQLDSLMTDQRDASSSPTCVRCGTLTVYDLGKTSGSGSESSGFSTNTNGCVLRVYRTADKLIPLSF
eukprot:gene5210-10429_t